MVKKLISGVLGKKDNKAEEKEAKKTEDVPDELPALAEDDAKDAPKTETAEKEPALPAAPKPVAKTAADSDELPSLDGGDDSDPEAAVPESDDAADAQDAAQEEPAKAAAAAPKEKASTHLGDHRGYFASLADLVLHKGTVREKALSEDLFKRMRDNWDVKKEELKDDALNLSESDLEQAVQQKMDQLSRLENKWFAQKKILEDDKKFLHEKEDEIKASVEELKGLLKELRIKQRVDKGNYLVLANGAIVRSLLDLYEMLRMIDQGTFRKHVRKNHNDFADWVLQIDEGVGRRLQRAGTRMKMLVVLESVVGKKK